ITGFLLALIRQNSSTREYVKLGKRGSSRAYPAPPLPPPRPRHPDVRTFAQLSASTSLFPHPPPIPMRFSGNVQQSQSPEDRLSTARFASCTPPRRDEAAPPTQAARLPGI